MNIRLLDDIFQEANIRFWSIRCGPAKISRKSARSRLLKHLWGNNPWRPWLEYLAVLSLASLVRSWATKSSDKESSEGMLSSLA